MIERDNLMLQKSKDLRCIGGLAVGRAVNQSAQRVRERCRRRRGEGRGHDASERRGFLDVMETITFYMSRCLQGDFLHQCV
ncbi:hypothetical protein chiPu_0010778 [Chiloscyllium punctatum]|uniref:Uncharacterized protein n=1 Tax=Chiloscyllium punctatum TaxID=137246 RepID=A0A401SPJ8_CHIPU|nr:hypothetical protein [Chiloscyllium punctatum]